MDSDASRSFDALYVSLYSELRSAAHRIMRDRERAGHTLQPTALVNATYEKLRRNGGFDWIDRSHAMAICVRAMKQVLIDHARLRNSGKRGGRWQRITLSNADPSSDFNEVDIFDWLDSLQSLAKSHPSGLRMARLIELVHLGGFTFQEAADLLGISRRQAHRDWRYAKAWLLRELASSFPSAG